MLQAAQARLYELPLVLSIFSKEVHSSLFHRLFSLLHASPYFEKAIADANHPMEEETVGVLITGSVITVGEARAILKDLK